MKKQINVLLYIIIAISLVVCTFIGAGRVNVENSYKNVEIAVRYNDVLRIATEGEVPIEQVLAKFKELGATTIFAKENTVASATEDDYYNYKGLGKVSIIEGYILKFYYPEITDLNPESRYIMSEDESVVDHIYENYETKGLPLTKLKTQDVYFLEIGDNSPYLTTVGVGFTEENLQKAADMGYSISLQIKNWDVEDETVLKTSLEYVMDEIRNIPNVNTIYFSDAKVPGASTDLFANFIADNYNLGFIEFSSNKQEGFNTLAKKSSKAGTDYKVVRLHTLEDSKVNTFSVSELMDRYDLALKERNNRVFLFKLPNSGMLEKDYEYMEEAITTFATDIIADGYTLTNNVGTYNLPIVPAYLTLLAGLAAICVFVLFVGEFGFIKTGYVLGGLGIVGYAGLLMKNTNLACQLMALFGSIIFPTYAMVKVIKHERRNLKDALIALITICGISFGGVLTTIGVLSKTNFALGLDVFAGVKAATILPIILVLVYLIYREHKFDVKYYLSVLDRKISYGAVIIIAILAGVLFIYVSRSGNSGTTTSLELAFRQFLDNVLGVRPRTKEILIGYPILLGFLYYGYKERYIIFMIFAIMGPISLVNTYAHIHTPIIISLIRSAYGILIGAVVGLVLIWLIKLISKVIKKWQMQLK